MDSNKEIKVYGTFVNWTVNDGIKDNDHNDAVAYAKQLYDDRFGASPNAANFQDVINKRLTAISYVNGITTIDSPFVVNGNSTFNGSNTINGNETVTGNSTINGTLSVQGASNLHNTNISGNIVATGNISTASGTLNAKTLNITENGHVGGLLDVGHLKPMNGLTVVGNTDLGGTLSVGGNATFNANASIPNGELSCKTLHVTNNGAIDGTTTTRNLVVTANGAQISGDSSITGTLTVSENISSPNVNKVIQDVAVLNGGKNVNNSVDYKIEQLWQRILVGVDPETLDSLNDIIEWISRHEDVARGILLDIQNLKSKDVELNDKIDQEILDRSNADTREVADRNAAITNAITPVNNTINRIDTRVTTLEQAHYVTDTSLQTTLVGYVKGTDLTDYAKASELQSLIDRVSTLEQSGSLWTLVNNNVTTTNNRPAVAAGFYDSTVS